MSSKTSLKLIVFSALLQCISSSAFAGSKITAHQVLNSCLFHPDYLLESAVISGECSGEEVKPVFVENYFNDSLRPALNRSLAGAFESDLYYQIIFNAAFSRTVLKSFHQPINGSFSNVVGEICDDPSENQKCSQNTKKNLNVDLGQLKDEFSKSKPRTDSQIRDLFNGAIRSFNQALSQIKIRTKNTLANVAKVGQVMNGTPEPLEGRAALLWSKYYYTYEVLRHSDVGVLLNTDIIQNKMGKMRYLIFPDQSGGKLSKKTSVVSSLLSSALKSIQTPYLSEGLERNQGHLDDPVSYHFAPLNELTEQDVRQAREEALRDNAKIAHDANSIARAAKDPNDSNDREMWDYNLRRLIKLDPVAVGELLAQDPRYLPLVCSELNSIESASLLRKKVFSVATLFGGVAASLFGQPEVGIPAALSRFVGVSIGAQILQSGVHFAASNSGYRRFREDSWTNLNQADENNVRHATEIYSDAEHDFLMNLLIAGVVATPGGAVMNLIKRVPRF